MLIDTINETIIAIETKRNAQAQRLSNQKLSESIFKLKEIGSKLETDIEALRAMSKTGVNKVSPLNEQHKRLLLEAINACGRGIRDCSIDDKVIHGFEAQVRVVEQSLSYSWQQAAKDYSSGVISYLAILENVTANPEETKELLNKIKVAQNEQPTAKRIIAFVENVNRAQAIIERYELNPEISTFLSKIKNKQATLEDLSPSILAWLKENKLTEKLAIIFRQTS